MKTVAAVDSKHTLRCFNADTHCGSVGHFSEVEFTSNSTLNPLFESLSSAVYPQASVPSDVTY